MLFKDDNCNGAPQRLSSLEYPLLVFRFRFRQVYLFRTLLHKITFKTEHKNNTIGDHWKHLLSLKIIIIIKRGVSTHKFQNGLVIIKRIQSLVSWPNYYQRFTQDTYFFWNWRQNVQSYIWCFIAMPSKGFVSSHQTLPLMRFYSTTTRVEPLSYGVYY